jgi:hypothetical protein
VLAQRGTQGFDLYQSGRCSLDARTMGINQPALAEVENEVSVLAYSHSF